jgi:hypothetical protein
MSSFAAPLKVYGTKEGPDVDAGIVICSQAASLVFGATDPSPIFKIPPNCQVIEIYLDTTIIFDAATTITIGKTGGAADFFVAATTTITAVGRIIGSVTADDIGEWIDTGATQVEVNATITEGASATGAVVVTMVYAVNKILLP